MGNLTQELIASEKMREYDRKAAVIWQQRKRDEAKADPSLRKPGIFSKKGKEENHDRGIVCGSL